MRTLPDIDPRFTFAHDKPSELEISVPGFSVRITASDNSDEFYGEVIISCDEDRQMQSLKLRLPVQGMVLKIEEAAAIPGALALEKLPAPNEPTQPEIEEQYLHRGITVEDVGNVIAVCAECMKDVDNICAYCDRCANCAPGGLHAIPNGEMCCNDVDCNGFDIGATVFTDRDIMLKMLHPYAYSDLCLVAKGTRGTVKAHDRTAVISGKTHLVEFVTSNTGEKHRYYVNPNWLHNIAF